MVDLFKRLTQEREKTGLAVEAFGAVAGVKKAAQYNYEKGDRVPDARYLANIAKIGCDVQYIITGEPSTAKLTDEERELLELFRGAKRSLKTAALAVLESEITHDTKEPTEISIGSHVSGSGNTVNVDMNKGKKE